MTTVVAELPSYTQIVEILENLPLLVRETRRARGLSMQTAADQIGCSGPTVHRIEHGDDVSHSNIIRILLWFGGEVAA